MIMSLRSMRTAMLCIRKFSTQVRKFEEIKIPVPWGHIAGKWWEPYNTRPILTIHGWQDNCGSFDRLIPLLSNDVGFLTIDLPGHGYSSRLPPGMYYNNLNYLILIQQIAFYFKWSKLSLMGHSLGSISCYFYTMIYPENVDFLICIDGVKPLLKLNNGVRMAEGIHELIKYDEQSRSSREPPSYNLDDIKKIISTINDASIDIEQADIILKRNLRRSTKDPNKYYLNRDPRLKSRLILNWSQEELIKWAERVTCPMFMSKASRSSYYENKQNFYDVLEVLKKSTKAYELHYVEGTHHVHLNNPVVLNKLINKFIAKHNTENRSEGGIRTGCKTQGNTNVM